MSLNIKNKQENTELDIPKIINIDNVKYSYKCKLAKKQFSYRCFHRACKVLLTINKENLQKIIYKKDYPKDVEITYKTNNKEHSCFKAIKHTTLLIITTNKEEEEIIISLIKKNLDKSISWHQNNFKNNAIEISFNRIKNLLQKIRQEEYALDDEFLFDLSKIRITLLETDTRLKNLLFYFGQHKIISKYKTQYREKNFILFTSLFQLRKFSDVYQIFMDGIFLSSPKKYYQIFNILGKEKNSGKIIPLIYVLMSPKSFDLYYTLFSHINTLLIKLNIEVNFDKIAFMLDFEKTSRLALIKVFPKSPILGCYFHYVKAFWYKAKKIGLTRKKHLKETMILLFTLKLYQFIRSEERDEYIKIIDVIFKDQQPFNIFI